jgi:hypothetical protein
LEGGKQIGRGRGEEPPARRQMSSRMGIRVEGWEPGRNSATVGTLGREAGAFIGFPVSIGRPGGEGAGIERPKIVPPSGTAY